MNSILEDREKRYNKILDLIYEYKMSVLCGKINYPGNNKNTSEVNKAFTILMKKLRVNFSSWIKGLEIINGNDGPAILLVIDMNVFEAKEIAILIEEQSSIGRIFDIDIYKEDGASVSRSDIGLRPRKCLICDADGRVCMRLGKHSLEEVIDNVNMIIKNYGEVND